MELSGAEPVHSLNHRSCVFNGSLRQDAVAKIENMSGTIARTTQNPLDPRFNDLNGSEKCHGVQVPLDSLPHPLDSLLEEWHMFLGLQRKERIHILYRAHGIAYDRTFSFSKRQIHPHARKRQQDVCKDDGRVKVESPHGLEGDLSGEFRSPAHLQERAVSPQGPVLLQVPPCLSHHPNWRTVYLFPPAGL